MKELEFKGLKEKLYVHEHKSGLVTYMWVNEKIKSCLMTMTVPYGSIHTDFKIKNKKYHVPNGLAHFLEHLKFNETDDFTAHDFFYKSGGDANAFTTFNYTEYILYTTMNIPDNLNHFLDFIYNPYFTKKNVQKEKGIIIEEANMTKDDPNSNILYTHLKNMFKESNYRHIITGEEEDIKNISVDDLFNVYNAFYHPANMFMCLTGNFNPYEMAKIIDDNLDQKEFAKFVKPEIIQVKEPKEVVKKFEEINLKVTTPKVKYGLKIPRNKFKEYGNWDLLLMLRLILNINFGLTSDFREELTNKGLIIGMYPSCLFIDDYVGIFITIDTNYPKEVVKRFEEKLNNLEITEEELNRKIKSTLATTILDFDDIENMNESIINGILLDNQVILNIKERIQNITYDMIQDLINKIDLKNSSVLVVNQEKENTKD